MIVRDFSFVVVFVWVSGSAWELLLVLCLGVTLGDAQGAISVRNQTVACHLQGKIFTPILCLQLSVTFPPLPLPFLCIEKLDENKRQFDVSILVRKQSWVIEGIERNNRNFFVTVFYKKYIQFVCFWGGAVVLWACSWLDSGVQGLNLGLPDNRQVPYLLCYLPDSCSLRILIWVCQLKQMGHLTKDVW